MNEKFFSLPEDRQHVMLNAGFAVFSRNAYKKASMDDVAREAGVSKALLFHYFESKSGLYLYLHHYAMDYLVDVYKRQLVMIEEPETHLHPRFQRKMAEILLGMAQEGKQVLITSHSDHILQTLGDLVGQGGFPKEDVKVYHFEKQGRETKAAPIDLFDKEAVTELFV